MEKQDNSSNYLTGGKFFPCPMSGVFLPSARLNALEEHLTQPAKILGFFRPSGSTNAYMRVIFDTANCSDIPFTSLQSFVSNLDKTTQDACEDFLRAEEEQQSHERAEYQARWDASFNELQRLYTAYYAAIKVNPLSEESKQAYALYIQKHNQHGKSFPFHRPA